MKVYFARPINLYNTNQDERDIETIKQLGFIVVNPNKLELQSRYEKEGMDVFFEALSDCDAIFFRSFYNLKISAGVQKEIDKGIELNKIIIELPTLTEERTLSVADTRNYLKYTGYR